MTEKQGSLIVLALFIVVYLLPLEIRPLFIPDETRYAEIPREMLATGNWIVPKLNGLLYFEKPVMGYWLIAISQAIFGANSFAVRLPMALATGLTALFTFLLARRKNDPLRAPLAALIFLSCLEIIGVGSYAIIDALLNAFLTGALFFFHRGVTAQARSGREKIMLLMAGIFCGLAFLTKGFLAFAVPGLTMAAFLIWQRRFVDLLRLAWLPLLAALLISLPWAWAIHQQAPDFWRYFFWEEHMRRFMANNAQHKKGFWYFLINAPAIFFPWILALPPAIVGLRQPRINLPAQEKNLRRFLYCWFALPFLFFSLASGKLLTYIIPCFPPAAILLAMGLRQYFSSGQTALFRKGAAIATLFTGLIMLLFVALQLFGFHGFRPYALTWKWLLVTNALAIMTILFAMAWRGNSRSWGRLCAMGCAPLALALALQVALPDLTLEKKAPGAFIQRQQPHITPGTLVLSDEDLARAVCWYLKRSDIYLIGNRGELAYGIDHATKERHLSLARTKQIIQENPGNTVLFVRRRHLHQQFTDLPQPRFRDNNGENGYVFLQY